CPGRSQRRRGRTPNSSSSPGSGRLKERSERPVSVGGAGFASTLVELDLIDEYRLFVNPVVLGGGTPYFPALDKRTDLELVETRTFGSRVVYVRYRRVRADLT
ncbi:MAG TPA: dihydrofolate reductase family protein, partial [Actinomycetota bacterium]|nr:dihydrofolate reductase family protein [Actinomycetota bacterium]